MTPVAGYYNGTITDAGSEMDYEDKNLIMWFDVDLLDEGNGEQVTCKHMTTDKFAEISRKIAESLELPWPTCLRDMSPCVGKQVRVHVKHKEKDGKTYINAYIAIGRERKPATPEQTEMAIAKLEAKQVKPGDKDGFPF